MSINFTSDIDGAASGSGITKITVGGKTINLTEVSSGSSGGVVSGSFTPEEQTANYTIDTGIDFKRFFVSRKSPALDTGTRTIFSVFVDIESNLLYLVFTNSSGISLSGIASNWEANLNGCSKDGTNIAIAVNATSRGQFFTSEYVWYAW